MVTLLLLILTLRKLTYKINKLMKTQSENSTLIDQLTINNEDKMDKADLKALFDRLNMSNWTECGPLYIPGPNLKYWIKLYDASGISVADHKLFEFLYVSDSHFSHIQLNIANRESDKSLLGNVTVSRVSGSDMIALVRVTSTEVWVSVPESIIENCDKSKSAQYRCINNIHDTDFSELTYSSSGPSVYQSVLPGQTYDVENNTITVLE